MTDPGMDIVSETNIRFTLFFVILIANIILGSLVSLVMNGTVMTNIRYSNSGSYNLFFLFFQAVG